MIKYGSEQVSHLRFASFDARLERRNEQWIDVVLRFELAVGSDETPADLIDLTALVICTHQGQIAQIVPQDEEIDCEYQFTSDEKAQIVAYIESPTMQSRIRQTAG